MEIINEKPSVFNNFVKISRTLPIGKPRPHWTTTLPWGNLPALHMVVRLGLRQRWQPKETPLRASGGVVGRIGGTRERNGASNSFVGIFVDIIASLG